MTENVVDQRLYTREEAAEYLRVTPRTITRYVSDRKIKFQRPGGKNLLFRREDLDEFVARGGD